MAINKQTSKHFWEHSHIQFIRVLSRTVSCDKGRGIVLIETVGTSKPEIFTVCPLYIKVC